MISTTLSFQLLTCSTASLNPLLIPSSVFFTSVILLLNSDWLFFIFSVSLKVLGEFVCSPPVCSELLFVTWNSYLVSCLFPSQLIFFSWDFVLFFSLDSILCLLIMPVSLCLSLCVSNISYISQSWKHCLMQNVSCVAWWGSSLDPRARCSGGVPCVGCMCPPVAVRPQLLWIH